MAIQSASEFEAVINRVTIQVEKALSARGSVPPLETADRQLAQLFEAARKPSVLKAQRAHLEKTTDTLTNELPGNTGLLDDLWDLADYIDYRA